ncbi:hypothetical protein GOV12_07955, partial [Candidatus Pacearchaeota archaeon]|nr:hypothetical protein [Candidatus Pacearchaeota archaeon]
MVYKKFEKKGDKVFGPYYYESYRDGDKVRKVYIGGEKEYKEWLKKKRKEESRKNKSNRVEQLNNLKLNLS